MSQATLYTLPGSHPGIATALMLEYKGIEYDRVDLMPVISKAALRALGFPGMTVPAVRFSGRKLQGSVEIARGLDEIVPEPPLLPEDQGPRERVLEAERFGEEELQHPIRQILWWLLKRNRNAMYSYAENAKLPVPTGLAVRTSAPIVAASVHFNRASDENVRSALASLAEQLDRIDSYIEEGIIGNERPNAADFQIAASVRLAMTVEDLRPAIESRPAGELALRLVPEYDGHLPPGLPQEWLEPLTRIRQG
jgi:glutathione S-transferase